MRTVECVPNFSEGRDRNIVDQMVSEITKIDSVKLLDVQLAPTHNRSVVSYVVSYEMAVESAFAGIRKAADLIDMTKHKGEHPRFGASDVIPFIPISETTIEDCVKLAHELGKIVAERLSIPVFLYGSAAKLERRRNLEDIRSKSFQYEQLSTAIGEDDWKPDFGPSKVGRAGASIIGARDFLVAFNVNLNTRDINTGKKIAKALRARDGGLAFVKALAFYLEDKQMVQISMNLTSFRKTPIYRAFEMVKLEANRYGIGIAESEIVGLVPLDALVQSAEFYMQLNGFKTEQIFEKKLWSE
jgi:glutamate formiminotransferase